MLTCRNCGTNFMAHNEIDKEDRLCNTCQHRGVKKMEKPNLPTTAQLLVTVSYQDQVQIEELCTNRGISISNYFISLFHRDTLGRATVENVELPNTVNFISVPVDSKYFDGVPTDEVQPIVEKKKAGRPKK